jgi:ABC-2 type transport system permease protein
MFLLLSGAYVASNMFLVNVASLQTFFDVAPLLLLLFAPAVTMRLIAEEKRLGTFELLNTKPVSIGGIVTGKFLAAWLLVIFALVPTVFYVVTVMSLGNLDAGAVTGGYIGLILLGGVFAAAGTFGSSLSSNQIVALIISFVIGFVLFVLDKVLLYVPLPLVGLIEYLGVGHHYASLARGVIDSRAVVYHLSLMALFLVFAELASAQEPGQSLVRWKDFRLGTKLTRAAFLAGILVFVNLFAARMFVRFDITENRAFTLSDVTKELLGKLDDTFLVRAYFTPDLPPPYHNHRKIVQQHLEEFRAYSNGRLHYKFVNPFAGPVLEEEALREGVAPIQVRVIRNNRFQRARAYVGLALSYADRQEHIPVLTSLERVEYEIAASLKKMTSREIRTIGILADAGGPDPGAMRSFLDAVGRQHAVVPVSLAREPVDPRQISALLVIAPARPFSDLERIRLDQYIMHGGRVAFFMNAVVPDALTQRALPAATNLDEMFDVYGWIIPREIVADGRCAPYVLQESTEDQTFTTDVLYPFYPIAADFNPADPLVRHLPPVAFSFVSPVDVRLAGIRGVTARVMVSSSRQARRVAADTAHIDPRTPLRDPLTEALVPLGAVVEGSFRSAFADARDPSIRELLPQATGGAAFAARSPQTRIAVVGDGDFVLDSKFHGQDNTAFGVNMVDWLLGDTLLTTIRTRDVAPQPLMEVSEETKTFAKYFSFAAPPGIVVATGLLWMAVKAARRRRHKHSY